MNHIKHNRQSMRLTGYDYSSLGAYFVTVCTHHKTRVFGEVVDGKMQLNIFGEVIHNAWFESQEIRKEIKLDAFVVMPNHIHGIIWIVQSDHPVGATGGRPQDGGPPLTGSHLLDEIARVRSDHCPIRNNRRQRPNGPRPRSLSAFMAGFKSACSKKISPIRRPANAPLWQRGYYDHIIRNEDDLHRIKEYIMNNPSNWASDRFNTQTPRATAGRPYVQTS